MSKTEAMITMAKVIFILLERVTTLEEKIKVLEEKIK